MDLVKVWRKVWPQEQFKGPRGGMKKSGRPHWIGPGRVVFSEVLPHQRGEDDGRRHVVWVLIGNQLLRCSVHSVRPVTETEHFVYETTSSESPSSWRSLAGILPRREYHDILDQAPKENEVEVPQLPPQPDSTTTAIPTRRLRQKVSFKPGEYVDQPVRERLQRQQLATDEVNDYEEKAEPSMDPSSSSTSAQQRLPGDDDRSSRPAPTVNEYDQPEPKKARTEISDLLFTKYDLKWVEELELGAAEEAAEPDLLTVMEEVDECLCIEFDLPRPTSNRQKKQLERNPVLYLVKKMRDSEVNIIRLPPRERELFVRAKMKEVGSFISNEAVRRCLDNEEVKKAYDTQRIVRARWVLTWKPVPPEDREQALEDAQRPNTLHTPDGQRKAKALIVLLGFQHPSLLDPSFKTSSPVQSSLGRNLMYLMSVQHQWPLEGLDLATAFLQTLPTEADAEIWTSGVQELREALGLDEDGIMRVMRNIYGPTPAPRGLWLSLHRKLVSLGACAVKVIGAMGGHVDDFHRIGDGSPEWLEVKAQVDASYKWGTVKSKSYRFAGTDIETIR